MWERKEVKAKGKSAFKANYWKCVLVSFVLALITGATAGSYSGSGKNLNGGQIEFTKELITALLIVISIAFLISILIEILLRNPLKVGCYNFYKKNCVSPAKVDEMGFGFKSNYKNVVCTMFIKDLFLLLWSCLFIIPGIIKAYSYRMVPYILSDNPDMNATDAITKSREMMKGNKWRAFVLDLSFIGWVILGALTFGILLLFYVAPYKDSTDAELYHALKGNEQ